MSRENRNKKLMFFGDLPPKYLDGISISSKINLELLSDKFDIVIVEEENDFSKHDSAAWSKISQILNKLRQLARELRKEKPNVFYLTYSLSTFGALKTLGCLLTAKWNSNTYKIMHVHRGDFFLNFHNSFLNKFTTKRVFSLVDKIVVLSQEQKKEFESKLPTGKYCVLENTIQEEYEIDKEEKWTTTFLYVSNYLKEKGIFDLLEVFKNLTEEHENIRLITYGRFPNKEIEKSIRAYASSQIEINATIRGKEKFNQMAAADALILPSWNEGQPITILEALSVKTPVIVTTVGLIPEMMGKDYPYLCEAKNHKELEAIILKFINDPSKDALRSRIYERYINVYSRQSHQRKLEEIFV